MKHFRFPGFQFTGPGVGILEFCTDPAHPSPTTSRPRCRRRTRGRGEGAPLRPSANSSRTVPACARPLPRWPRAGHRRRQGSAMRLNRGCFLFNVRSVGRPSLTANTTFGEPIDLGICVFAYGDCRPEPVIPQIQKTPHQRGS
jgi:hypothetical protein